MVHTRALLANITSSRIQCAEGRKRVAGENARPLAVISWLPQVTEVTAVRS